MDEMYRKKESTSVTFLKNEIYSFTLFFPPEKQGTCLVDELIIFVVDFKAQKNENQDQ